ncbi:MAG: penicillin acylase family protein [Phycisphaerales bacterium]
MHDSRTSGPPTQTTPAATPPASRAARRGQRRLGAATVGAAIAQSIASLLAGGWASLRASLPALDGQAPLPALSAPATIERDALGIATINAASELDAYRALGYAHAQDRLFQMDANRRSAAGRLAEWLGPAGLPEDIAARSLFLEDAAQRALNDIDPRHREILTAYAEGVNAGMASLEAPPPEYLLLAVEPEPWTPKDSLLIALNMCRYLAYGGASRERLHAVLLDSYPKPLLDFFFQPFSRFDTVNEVPNFGTWAFQPATPPGPDIINLRAPRIGAALPPPHGNPDPAPLTAHHERPHHSRSTPPASPFFPIPPLVDPPDAIGSNNWALAGGRTEHAGAILANDMHLGLMVPNTWYRADINWTNHRLVGLTLPGLPGLVVGSNTRVAWGFTNVHGDFVDHILIEADPDNPDRYRTPDRFPTSTEPFTTITTEISVRGGDPVVREWKNTRWGPVNASIGGRPAVAKWTCTEPGGLNLAILDIANAGSAADAAEIFARWHGPPQNVAIADRDGRIALVISGYIPRRLGFDGTAPTSWADGTRRWGGLIDRADRFAILGQGNGRIISANARVTSDLAATRIMGEPFTLGIRQLEIERALAPLQNATERDMLAVQLDTRASFYDFYRDLLLAHIAEDTNDATLRAIREALTAWDGHADADSRGLVFLSDFAGNLQAALLDPIAAHFATDNRPAPRIRWPLIEEPVRRLIETQPPNFLPPDHDTWTALFLTVAKRTHEGIARDGLRPDAPWGEARSIRISHPLMLAIDQFGLPQPIRTRLAQLLNYAPEPRVGHWNTIRVQTDDFGASQRLVVAPGREDHAILHMPTGQSGHFLSPYYRAGHADWLDGNPTPLEAGPTRHTLTLTPAPAPAPKPD